MQIPRFKHGNEQQPRIRSCGGTEMEDVRANGVVITVLDSIVMLTTKGQQGRIPDIRCA